MRYVCSLAAAMSAVAFLAPSPAFGQGLSITNYQFISEVRFSRTQSYVTYSADLVNAGAALPSVTAALTSLDASIQTIPGQDMLHFSPVPANSQIPGSNTFTILVDRTVPFTFSNLHWSFNNPFANPGPNQTAKVGDKVTLNGTGSTNPAGTTLSYSWSFASKPAGSNATIANSTSAIASFTVDAAGQYV